MITGLQVITVALISVMCIALFMSKINTIKMEKSICLKLESIDQ